MRKLKLMTIVGTRPEIIKLSEVIKKCDIYFDHVLVDIFSGSWLKKSRFLSGCCRRQSGSDYGKYYFSIIRINDKGNAGCSTYFRGHKFNFVSH